MNDGQTLVLIPARMASTRLPNKPLADIVGLPMIVHVLNRAAEAGIGGNRRRPCRRHRRRRGIGRGLGRRGLGNGLLGLLGGDRGGGQHDRGAKQNGGQGAGPPDNPGPPRGERSPCRVRICLSGIGSHPLAYNCCLLVAACIFRTRPNAPPFAGVIDPQRAPPEAALPRL